MLTVSLPCTSIIIKHNTAHFTSNHQPFTETHGHHHHHIIVIIIIIIIIIKVRATVQTKAGGKGYTCWHKHIKSDHTSVSLSSHHVICCFNFSLLKTSVLTNHNYTWMTKAPNPADYIDEYFTAHIWLVGVTDIINYSLTTLKPWQWTCTMVELQMLWITPVCFQLGHVKMSPVKKTCWSDTFFFSLWWECVIGMTFKVDSSCKLSLLFVCYQ